jgi:hypothetical protein
MADSASCYLPGHFQASADREHDHLRLNNSSARFVASPCCRNLEWLSEALAKEVEVIEIYSIQI